MSLCDTCMSPGYCCKKVALSGGDRTEGRFEDPMSFEEAEHKALKAGLPFRPGEQCEDGTWRWWCTNLLPNGRCGDYENRPGLCSRYVAGSDPLCVHYWNNGWPVDTDVFTVKRS